VPADEIGTSVILSGDRALIVTEGIETARVQPCGLEAAGACELRLNGAPIALRIVDAAALERARARMLLHVAALLVGVARAACAYATRYAAERTAFGRPIAHHQALAFLLVDMATAVDAARMAVWRAAAAIDCGAELAWAGTSAFAEAAEQALFVTPSAVQVLGGHGFMKDHPVEKYMRDARTLAQLGGGRDHCELEAAAVVVEHDLGLT
jgi:alkylation response protein AidB-like acyl-CoA dehydrogenase